MWSPEADMKPLSLECLVMWSALVVFSLKIEPMPYLLLALIVTRVIF
jgi:hypothetical protein